MLIIISQFIILFLEEGECVDKCTNEEDLVCGDDGVTYHNQCLLDLTACTNGITIKVGHKGPCPLGDKNENNKGTKSDDFVTFETLYSSKNLLYGLCPSF